MNSEKCSQKCLFFLFCPDYTISPTLAVERDNNICDNIDKGYTAAPADFLSVHYLFGHLFSALVCLFFYFILLRCL